MTDNFAFTPGSGATGAAKDVSGVLYPQVIATESDGTDTGLSAKLGSLTETAPATDTASSGLNGRLQRIAQRITSLIALVPAALTGSGNFKTAVSEWVAGVIAAVGGDVASGSADSGNPVKVGGRFNSTNPTLTDGQRGDLQLGSRGSLRIELWTPSGGSAIATSVTNADGVTVGSVSSRLEVVARASVFNGTTWDRLYGTTVGLYNVIRDAAGNARGANVNAQNALQVSQTPTTSGGLDMSKTISGASTNATSVKGSAGQVYAIQAFNNNASARYLKLYNKASAPTVGSDTPVKVLEIPGNSAGAGFVITWPNGIAFGTGIAFALTTGITDADTGAVAANEIAVNIDYF